jgi:hypothetical protein
MTAGNFKANDKTVLFLAIPVVGIIAYVLWKINKPLTQASDLTANILGGANDAVKTARDAANTLSKGVSYAAGGLGGWWSDTFEAPTLQWATPEEYKQNIMDINMTYKGPTVLNAMLSAPLSSQSLSEMNLTKRSFIDSMISSEY